MIATRFARIVLRTTDVESARAFYAEVLGRTDLDIEALPAAALARGAPPHWLGMLAVRDVELAARELVSRGGTRLGDSVVRDAGGAVVGLMPRATTSHDTGVAWHELNTPDVEHAVATYRSVCDWAFGPSAALGSVRAHRVLAYHDGGPSVGAIASIEGRPNVHPHWLFHFAVRSLDEAVAAARERGALIIGPFTIPGGVRVAVCDDPLGAAFAMREMAR